jgi:hypothetical protein
VGACAVNTQTIPLADRHIDCGPGLVVKILQVRDLAAAFLA